ncbi:V-type ATP synthase subunit I [Stappia sp. ES.058]|uniref:V-type ATP synthase subunit I n=1 Tax=Stappia sp. ES.058 TaxID=1881061 RepID=UPI00087B8BC4|nr:V-type ATP synthase subunit I [Stappia sp. ES.058]SDU02741.1 V/A-type H+-transporting ATPase subunit I [Stappia sp. ES.058]
MTIVALRKISLIGVMEDKAAVLDAVQAFGGCHLVPLRAAQKDLEAVPSGTGREATEALRWLVDCPAPRRVVSRDPLFDLSGVVSAANRNRHELMETEDRKAALEKRIRDVARWGEFTFPDMSDIGGYRFWFYEVPLGREKVVTASGAIVETVHRERGIAYMVVLSPEEPPVDSMPVPRVHIGSHALSTLLAQLEAVEILLDDLWLERRDLTKWRLLLAENLARARDAAARRRAALETIDAERVFVMRGWARADRVAEIAQLADRLGIAALVEDPAPEDDPPTLLENAPAMAAGEDLVQFYQTPGYRSWDPSSVVYVSFIVFFGMIMTDAGYGLFLLVLLFLLRGRFQGSALGRRMVRLGYWLAVSTMAFGVATGSYFGWQPPGGGLIAHAAFIDLSDIDAMMRLTVTIGVAHVVAANVLNAWNAGSLAGRLVPAGWCCAAFGGLLVYLTGGAQTAAGIALAGVGVVLVVAFGGEVRVTSLSTFARRLGGGLLSGARVVNLFSDVLSYMRLFALGLAAASLAGTINMLAEQVRHAVPGVGVLVAITVLVIGHAVNMGLGIVAGTVHGLRLNVIEFFNWGLKGEGRPFRPFRKEETRL